MAFQSLNDMKSIGKYNVLCRIGEGGMGVVYKGLDPLLQREVAIKLISERAFEHPEIKERFFREARSAGSLSHENITTVYELGESDGLPYIVMEYLTGKDLRTIIKNKEPLSVNKKLRYCQQICRGLEYSHGKNIIHRDIKPENIMILEDDKVKIMDFGLAKPESGSLTKKGTPLGTPLYMSPEQIKSLEIDRRTDIFSFGVLFYELLAYKTPFEGNDITLMYKILNEDPEKLVLEDPVEGVQQIISRCLQKEPEDRFNDCTELLEELDHALNHAQHEKQIQGLLAEGRSLAMEKRLHEAILKFNQILQIAPNHSEANSHIRNLLEVEKETSTIKILTGAVTGNVISHFRIIERLGGGGMGVVYKAEDVTLQRMVALKFLVPELTSDEEAKKRFFKEARAASALDHPNICAIHEISETEDGQIFICMAYYEGESLKHRIARGKLEILDCLNIATKIAQGLAKAHQHSILHRDIKPGNIIITTEDEVKIVDFGLAKLSTSTGTSITKTGTTMGTVPFMSPEQVRGLELDHRSDIWSYGVLLYNMLTAQLPFHSDYDAAIIYSIVNEEPVPVSELREEMPVELAAIVSKALSKDPNDRYASMNEILTELAQIQWPLARKDLESELSAPEDKSTDQATETDRQLSEEAAQNDESLTGLRQGERKPEQLTEEARLTEGRKSSPGQTETSVSEYVNKLLSEAESQLRQQKFSQAVETYKKILDIDPQNMDAKSGLTKALKGSATVAQRYSHRRRPLSFMRINISSKILVISLALLAAVAILSQQVFFRGLDQTDTNNLFNAAGVARQEMVDLKSEALELGAETKSRDKFGTVVQIEQSADQAFAKDDFASAIQLYHEARDGYRNLVDESKVISEAAETNLSALKRSVAQVRQAMLDEKQAAEEADAEANSENVYESALRKMQEADNNFKKNDRTSLIAAQKGFSDARNLFRQSRERAQVVKESEDTRNARFALEELLKRVSPAESDLEYKPKYQEAKKIEAAGDSLFKNGHYSASKISFVQAKTFYDEIASQVSNSLEKWARAARDSMLSIKRKIKHEQIEPGSNEELRFKEANKITGEADKAFDEEIFDRAGKLYQDAKNSYTTVIYGIKAKGEIAIFINDYKRNFEAGNPKELEKMYHSSQRSNFRIRWGGFFKLAQKIELSVEYDDQNLVIEENSVRIALRMTVGWEKMEDAPGFLRRMPVPQPDKDCNFDWRVNKVDNEWQILSETQVGDCY